MTARTAPPTVSDRASIGIAVAGLTLMLLATPILAQPHATEPLPIPLFSVSRDSPLNGHLPGAAKSVLMKPGPEILFSGAGMALTHAEDDLDDLSFNRAPAIPTGGFFFLIFGVDRASVGGAPPDPDFVSANRPFNVLDQADRGQAPGDLYTSLGIMNVDGDLDDPCRGRGGTANNTLAVNQGDTGGVDQDLSPERAPIQRCSGEADDADAAAYPGTSGRGDGSWLYFTVSKDSPSLPNLPGLPGTQSGADVFLDTNPLVAGTETRYAPADILGLSGSPTGDDIDALLVMDDGNGVFNAGIDAVFFSLDRGSPSLGANFSPADVFVSHGDGTFQVFVHAVDLGLNPATDNIDCLEVIPTSEPCDELYGHAIFLVWPGDVDRNGLLDELDCQAFSTCYEIQPPPAECDDFFPAFDTDYDDDVDCDDWFEFQPLYLEANGTICPLIPIPEFVSALLGDPLIPAHTCLADMNADHLLNGHDVQAYVQALLDETIPP